MTLKNGILSPSNKHYYNIIKRIVDTDVVNDVTRSHQSVGWLVVLGLTVL